MVAEITDPRMSEERGNAIPPLVSIIIRSMDRATLPDAINSIAQQTYNAIEVIVVDAKGTDHSELGEWCERFPLQIFSTGQRLKRSPAANLGLDSASGTYLIFLDDDDLFEPDHIANLVDTLHNSKNCSVAYAGVRVEKEKGITVGIFNEDFVAVRLMAENFIPIHAVLFNHDLVVQGCRFDENLDCYEDWDFWLQLTRQTDFAHTAKISAVYRAELGNSGMSLPLAHHLQRQRQCRLALWEKWRYIWTSEDFDHLVTDFRQQRTLLQEQLSVAAHTEDKMRCLQIQHEEQIATQLSIAAHTENKMQCLQIEHEEQIATQLSIAAHTENKMQCLQIEHEEQVATLNRAVFDSNKQIMQLRSSIVEIFDSNSWKLTAPIRFLSQAIRKFLSIISTVCNIALRYDHRESSYRLFKRAISIFRNEGLNGIKRRLRLFHNNQKINVDELKAKPIAQLEKHNYQPLSTIDIAKYDFFFLDVFDTAIIRLFQKPIDLFEYISFKKNDPDFHLRRVQQEARTREEHTGRKEISIFDIYHNLAADSIDEEIATELKFCVANPEIYDFYSKLLNAGKKIYFVSDMYLDKSTITNILKKNGFCTYEDVYVSSEDDLIKGDGSRFKWLKRNIPESIGTAIHIGDNHVADFLQPQTHGFDALHLMESTAYYKYDSFLSSKIESLNSKHSLGLSFILSTFKSWKSSFHNQAPDYWRQFGFLYGGALISAFCGFINKQLSKKKILCDKIYFLARDGDIMNQVYPLLYDNVQTEYLIASRRCMLFPSLKSLTHLDDEEALKQFIGSLGHSSAKDILERFGYTDLDNLEEGLINIGSDPSKWTQKDILDCILQNKQLILEKVVAERGLMFDYLTAMEFFDQDDIVIIDVGWNGSIQNALVKLLKLWNYPQKRLHGIYLGVNDDVAHKQNKAGFLFEGNHLQFVEYLNLMELITSSSQDGVIRIDRVGDNFVSVTGSITRYEQKRQLVAADIQKGIMDFAHLIKKQNIDSLDFIHADDFKALFGSLRSDASEEDVAQIGQLKHAAMIGSSFTHPILNLENYSIHNIKLVTAFINPEMYGRFFTSKSNVNCYDLIGIDNRQLNRGLPIIYNEVIEKYINDDCWLFFVHEDFEIKCYLTIVHSLDQGSVYGTFGINLEHDAPVGYGKHICSNKDGSDSLETGNEVFDTIKVQTLDCQSILIHTSLLAKHPHLRFDEQLTFDLYAEDFCINAREQLGIDVKVFPLRFQHYSHGKVTERYYTGLRYLAKKYPETAVGGSCSFIGGRANELEKKFKYDIPAYDNNSKA